MGYRPVAEVRTTLSSQLNSARQPWSPINIVAICHPQILGNFAASSDLRLLGDDQTIACVVIRPTPSIMQPI